MDNVVPFAPKAEEPHEQTIMLLIGDTPIISQYGQRLEIRADKTMMEYAMMELQDTLEAIRAVYRQMYDKNVSNACLTSLQSPVSVVRPRQADNDTI